ncbi:MAG: sugar ABC transporter substrate-binding protein [Treponema sp.]|jgi:ribose transport system substrate-binding protein|nr:sugar ABC transporter substrate-binding protein [Treponema sp.]
MKRVSFLAVVIILAVLTMGCTKKGESSAGGVKDLTDIRLGFVGMTLNNEYHVTLANGAKEKAKELGVNIDVQAGDQHASADQQLTIIENMLANNVDGIILVPSSSEGLESALRKCKEQGIPVINADTRLNADIVKSVGLEIPFYGTNNYEGARLAGQYAAANLPAGHVTAILTGIEGHQNTSDRLNGFKDGAGSAIKVVAEQTANWEVDQGYTAAQNIISAHPDLQLFFCSNDNMGIGALRAVEEAGLKEKIKIIGFDAVSEALNLVDSGDFLCTVAQYPAKMGELSVENIVKRIRGEGYELEIDTGCRVISKENVAEHKAYLEKYAD